LALNKHPLPLPSFQYVILLKKKGGKSVQKEEGLGQDPQNKKESRQKKINRKETDKAKEI